MRHNRKTGVMLGCFIIGVSMKVSEEKLVVLPAL